MPRDRKAEQILAEREARNRNSYQSVMNRRSGAESSADTSGALDEASELVDSGPPVSEHKRTLF
jgi:hypothetical protein